MEGAALLRRPRLPRRWHGPALHDAGRRLARRGARRQARQRALAAVRLRAAPGARAWSSPTGQSTCSAAIRSRACTTCNGDGEADFYECFSNAYATSPAGHDFICGLERDAAGNFYTASGNQGLLRISADGKTGRRAGDRLPQPRRPGPLPRRRRSPCPCSEGEWTPGVDDLPREAASRASDRRTSATAARKNGQPPDLPLVYLPRGLDNSSGGQVYVAERPLGAAAGPAAPLLVRRGHAISCVLRDEVDGQPQGAVVPLPGEFRSGVHRGRFNPKDGQLYVTGMAGWGTYTAADGCFQRVRYTGEPVQLPTAFHVHENGVLVTFARPVDRGVAEQAENHFAQAWNYRYSAGYGSPEFSPRHPGHAGPRPAAHRRRPTSLADGRTLFLEIPDLQPVNQLHLHLRVDAGRAARPVRHGPQARRRRSRGFPGYRPVDQDRSPPIRSWPTWRWPRKACPNPWRKPMPSARADRHRGRQEPDLRPRDRSRSSAGEPIQLTFANPDVVPHNWVLIKPGTLATRRRPGRTSIDRRSRRGRCATTCPRPTTCWSTPTSSPPQEQFTIYFRAPTRAGPLSYLCTFPGHWMVMNGEMIVE